MSTLSQFFPSGGGGIPVEVFLVGGGGGGGNSGGSLYRGCGGGSGQVLYGLYTFDYGKELNVTIGSGGRGSDYSDAQVPEPVYGQPGTPSKFGALVAHGGGGGGGGVLPGGQWQPQYTDVQNYGSSGGTFSYQPTFTAVCVNYPKGAEFIMRQIDQYGPIPSSTEAAGSGGVERYGMQNGMIVGRRLTANGWIATGAGNHTGGSIGAGGGGSGGHPNNSTDSVTDWLGQISGQSTEWLATGGQGTPASWIGYTSLEFAGGGGGATGGPTAAGLGRAGGGDGGYAPYSTNGAGSDATANSGSGGGGGFSGSPNTAPYYNPGGDGGSGCCIIRYPTQYSAATVTGTTTTPTQGGYYVYRWNGNGTITFNQ